MRYGGLYLAVLNLAVTAGMVALIATGRRIGARHLKDPERSRAGFGALEASVLALLGLVVAFTISGAGARFDVRRTQIVDETNAVGTAYLRLDVLPAAAQPALREAFRRYLDARVAIYRKLPDIAAAQQELSAANALQEEIWKQAVAAT